VAKVGTSNSDRTISLRLQCVVRKHNIPHFYFVLELLVPERKVLLNGLGQMTGVQFPARGVGHGVQTGPINLLYSGN
jgi:hypothetical protein